MPEIQIALLYEHTIFRNLVKDYLSNQPQFKVTQLADNCDQLITQLKDSPANIIVMDIFMPSHHMEQIVKQIKASYPDIPILLLPTSTDLENSIGLLSELLKLGIQGCISKVEELDELVKAISGISENKIYRTHLLTEALYHEKVTHSGSQFDVTFDDREKTIIKMLWEEKSNKEISDQVFLSIRSIEKIRLDLKKKLGVRSTIGILKYAITKKMLDYPENI